MCVCNAGPPSKRRRLDDVSPGWGLKKNCIVTVAKGGWDDEWLKENQDKVVGRHERAHSEDTRQESRVGVKRKLTTAMAVSATPSPAAASATSSVAASAPSTSCSKTSMTVPKKQPPKGVVLRSGRIRLPDKLMECLNNEVTPALFWQPDGQGFSIDCDVVQSELLDKCFHGFKISSFLRSLNRWHVEDEIARRIPLCCLSCQ